MRCRCDAIASVMQMCCERESERERERACETWVMNGVCVLLPGIRTEVTKAASLELLKCISTTLEDEKMQSFWTLGK